MCAIDHYSLVVEDEHLPGKDSIDGTAVGKKYSDLWAA